MSEYTEQDIKTLVMAATNLANAAENAGAILDERFEVAVSGPVSVAREALKPFSEDALKPWDGEIHDADLDVQVYSAVEGQKPRAVKIIHKPTGIGRMSESKATMEENREVAEKAILKALESRH